MFIGAYIIQRIPVPTSEYPLRKTVRHLDNKRYGGDAAQCKPQTHRSFLASYGSVGQRDSETCIRGPTIFPIGVLIRTYSESTWLLLSDATETDPERLAAPSPGKKIASMFVEELSRTG